MRTAFVLSIFLLSTTFLFAQSLPAVCFKSLSDYSIPTGTNPFSISTGDLNGDGKKDIAVANVGGGTVQVLFNAGNRRFEDGPTLDIGELPWVVLTADVDADGDLDIAALRSTSITIALNDSHGAFEDIQAFEIGDAYRMASGDFNSDGKIDLVSSGTSGLNVHISNGDGSFQAAAQTLEANEAYSVKVVDFNNDLKKDIIFVVGMDIKMYASNGNGTFTLKDVATFADNVFDFGCGDVNDDGKPDLLVVANGTYLVAGDGAGNFSNPTTFAHNISDIPLITDVDGDGENDIVIGFIGGVSVRIYKGQGGGTYDNPETHMAAASEVVVEDMDGDSKKDIVVVDSSSDNLGGVSVLFAQNGSYNAMKELFAPGAARDSFTEDLNGDGKKDLVITEQASHIFVYLNSPSGYGDADIYEVSNTNDVIAHIEKGKFNADAHTDFVVTLASGKVNLWLNDGDGTFTNSGEFNSGSIGGDVTAADFDGDLDLDLAITNRLDNKVAILLGNGAGSFAAPTSISVGNLPTSIASGDINNDNKIDLVVGNEGNDKISLVLGNGPGTFLTALDIVGGSRPNNHVSLADLNNDGFPELVALGFYQDSNVNPGYVAIRKNLGNGFAGRTEIACAGGDKGIGYGDFNGDGKVDLAVVGFRTRAVGVLLGRGDLTFEQSEMLQTGSGVIAATADVNADGALDIVAVSDMDNALLVLENTTAHAVASGPTTFCSGSVTLTGNSNAMVYQWTGGPNTTTTNSMIASKRGIYTLVASNYSGRCSTNSTIVVNGPPQNPEVQATNPSCNDLAGSIAVIIQNEDDTYSFDNGANYQASNMEGDLTADTYNVIIKSAAGCTSETTPVAIAAPPPTPPMAEAHGTDPNCENITGTINITVRSATDSYSFDGGINFIADHIATGLTPGTYPIVIMNEEGCMSPSVDFTLNEGPPIPQSLSVDTIDPTCDLATGTISVITQREGEEEYSFDNGETYQASNTKTGLASGLYQVLIRNQEGCKSEVTETVIYLRPFVPVTPVALVTQPTCSEATGSISIVMQSEGEQYSFDNGANFQTNMKKTSVASGPYSIVIKSVDGCTSPVATVIVKTQPATPGKPEVTATTQANGDVLLKGPAAASEYHWLKDGQPITSATAANYMATVSGNYSLLIVSSEGCSSKPSDPLAVVVVGDIYEGGSVTSRSYPNPATTTLYYMVESPNATGIIYNTSGAEIHVSSVRAGDQLIFDVTGLSAGLYLLKIEEEGAVKTIRWVKR
ncbi:MAG TPA: T9SS type A sorting domain-containing protein [Cyclobacteriaceae bacterium]|nr:T9SS type A sorting domain-containing protein [Cyclobacteriaceae bacterium]